MIKRLILIVTILFTVITNAQEGTSSPYSFYGIGLTTFQGTVENRSMGGISIFSDSIHVNLQNPAGYGKLDYTTFTVGGTHSMIDTKNGAGTDHSTVTSLDYLAIGIPAGKLGFGIGLVPYTSVGYDLFTQNNEQRTAGLYSGEGGLNRVFFSAGYQISNNFSLGVDANYNFGNIENKSIHQREDIQFASREINESTLAGFNFKLGLNYDQMLSENLELRASAIYSPESSLTSENERELATITFLSDGQEVPRDVRSISLEDTEMTMPAEYTLGSGIGQPRKWFLGVEYSTAEANNFNNRSFSSDRATYTNASSYRVGGFYIPDYNSLTSYLDRIVFRGGFRIQETGLNLGGEAINEFGISFGVGLPAGRNFSNANLGFEYGQRGTTDSGLIQEDFFKLSISLSLNDKWFIKRRFN